MKIAIPTINNSDKNNTKSWETAMQMIEVDVNKKNIAPGSKPIKK